MRLVFALCFLFKIARTKAKTSVPSPPHVVFILQDDLGYYDNGFSGAQEAEKYSSSLTALAQEGIRLTSHYTHWHCSPTRRSLLTGRLPLHHGEKLSHPDTDDIDLRWTWISEKLKSVGYTNYWFGKGHTGYRSMRHMPSMRGFDEFYGFLEGSGDYRKLELWNATTPTLKDREYSTDRFGELTLDAVERHNSSQPMFLYLPWQAVHEPYQAPPCCNKSCGPCDNVLHAMLREADKFIGRLTELLKKKSMYDNTLVVFTSDNGGVGDGNNYPLRGEKHTSWEGAMRTAAFVSGGLVPKTLRGTTSDIRVHIADWYTTLCNLAGVSPSDDSPISPEEVDPYNPNKDIYGEDSYPGVDGIDIWPALVGEDGGVEKSLQSRTLVLSREVLIKGDMKLIVAQPSPAEMVPKTLRNGWRMPNGTWEDYDPAAFPCDAYYHRAHFTPCLFNISSDLEERRNVATQRPEMVREMWRELNVTWLGAFTSRSPPELLGRCSRLCSMKHWWGLGGSGIGPMCGIKTCEREDVSNEEVFMQRFSA